MDILLYQILKYCKDDPEELQDLIYFLQDYLDAMRKEKEYDKRGTK